MSLDTQVKSEPTTGEDVEAVPLGVMWTSAHSIGEVIQAAREIARSGAANLHARESPIPGNPGSRMPGFLLSGRGAVIVVEHPTQALPPPDLARGLAAARLWVDDLVR